jgi:putative methionine-R-sulfoxide reductase with GAF domain
MAKKTTKFFDTYLKFSLESFQGRMTSGLLFVGLIVLVLVFYPVIIYRSTISQYEHLVNNSVPIKYYCSVLESLLGKTNMALGNFLMTDDRSYQTERRKIWQEDYKSAVDSLLHYTNTDIDAKTSSSVYAFIVEANRLKSEQENIEKEHRNLIDKDARRFSNEEDLTIANLRRLRQEQVQKLNGLVENANSILQEQIIKNQNHYLINTHTKTRANLSNIPIVSALLALIVLAGSFTVGYYVIRFVLKKIKILKDNLEQLDDGDLPETIIIGKDELTPIAIAVNQLTTHLLEVKNFALQVGQGNFDSEFKAFNTESDLGSALVQMRESLKSVSEEEKKRAWGINGLAMFSKLLRDNSQDFTQLCTMVIQELAKYVHAQQGGIYTVSDGLDDKKLILRSWYAYERKKYREKTVEIGEGVLGEAFREKQTVYMKKLPENYLKITSGLGEAEAGCLLVVPLKVNEEVEGMIEIAAFIPFEPYQIEFIEKVCESVASTLISVKINEKTKQLLENAQISGEMLRAQEEEMRQNMEELQATQEALHRKEIELGELLRQAEQREQKLLAKIKELEN